MRQSLTPPVSADDHRQGPDDAGVTLVEYGDFECPHCGRAAPVVDAVRRKLGDRLRFVFRHFPLSRIHEHAELAAEAAEAAGVQDKFWAMHEMLFRHQDDLSLPHLSRHAAAIGINEVQFGEDLSSRRFRERVRDHFMSGVHSGVNGTPTFFINGVRYDGVVDVEDLVAAIREALSARSGTHA